MRIRRGAANAKIYITHADGLVMADAVKLVPAVTGAQTSRWQGNVAAAGEYQFFAKWPVDATLASNAQYTLSGGTGAANVVAVSQSREGGQWRPLGIRTLAANDNWQVKLSDQAIGAVAADAVAVVPVASLGDQFRWSPTLPSAGRYDVFARWSAAAGRADRAEYRVTHSGGTSSVLVDQRNGAGQGGALWHYLGSYDLDPAAAPGHGVELLASLSGSVSADAIRFVKQGGAGGVSYILSDQVGQPQKMLEGATASLTWDRTANPFGDTAQMALGSSTANPLRFPGQQYDPVSGLHYNYFRDYDPSLGRYLQSDPIGLSGGVNTYAYVGGNPVNRTDRTGQIIDTLADVGFIGYDLYRLYHDGNCDFEENLAALGADVAGALIPGATGLGLGVRAAKAAKTAGKLGKEGESAVRAAYDIGDKAKIAVNGVDRVPDGINMATKTLSEVKNVGSQSFTKQLRDYSDYAQGKGYNFDLYTRPSTKLSGPLQNAIDSGLINHLHIPQ